MKSLIFVLSILFSTGLQSQVLVNPEINGTPKPGVFWIDTISKEVQQRISISCKTKLDTVIQISKSIENFQDSTINDQDSIIKSQKDFILAQDIAIHKLNAIISTQHNDNIDLRNKMAKMDKKRGFWKTLALIFGTVSLTSIAIQTF